MNTIADRVKNTIEERCPNTFSLYAGYGLSTNHNPVHFPTGVQRSIKRNDAGRCTLAKYQYADDSVLVYIFTKSGEAKLKVSRATNKPRK